jgi:uncharacterized protein (TIGR03435 family)
MIGIMVLLCSAALAQVPGFEVAVIKPALPMAEAIPLLTQGKLKAGISIKQSRVDMGFVTLTDLIVGAYKIRAYQIAGPDWLLMERFDIQAKLPDGAREDQVPEMLQTLLAERFGMRVHRESRTLSAYALVVGKSGAKLPLSTLQPDAEAAKGLMTLTPAAGGKVSASAGPAGPTQMTMGPNGIQLVLLKAKVSGFADLLSSILGKPVVDRTSLNGDYQITLDIPQEDVQNVARALGIGGPAVGTAGAGGSSMFQAVERYGLRLDARKEEMETLVVDHMERTPTQN